MKQWLHTQRQPSLAFAHSPSGFSSPTPWAANRDTLAAGSDGNVALLLPVECTLRAQARFYALLDALMGTPTRARRGVRRLPGRT